MSIVSSFIKARFGIPELNLAFFTSDAVKVAFSKLSTQDLVKVRDIIDSEVKRRLWSL